MSNPIGDGGDLTPWYGFEFDVSQARLSNSMIDDPRDMPPRVGDTPLSRNSMAGDLPPFRLSNSMIDDPRDMPPRVGDMSPSRNSQTEDDGHMPPRKVQLSIHFNSDASFGYTKE